MHIVHRISNIPYARRNFYFYNYFKINRMITLYIKYLFHVPQVHDMPKKLPVQNHGISNLEVTCFHPGSDVFAPRK